MILGGLEKTPARKSGGTLLRKMLTIRGAAQTWQSRRRTFSGVAAVVLGPQIKEYESQRLSHDENPLRPPNKHMGGTPRATDLSKVAF